MYHSSTRCSHIPVLKFVFGNRVTYRYNGTCSHGYRVVFYCCRSYLRTKSSVYVPNVIRRGKSSTRCQHELGNGGCQVGVKLYFPRYVPLCAHHARSNEPSLNSGQVFISNLTGYAISSVPHSWKRSSVRSLKLSDKRVVTAKRFSCQNGTYLLTSSPSRTVQRAWSLTTQHYTLFSSCTYLIAG